MSVAETPDPARDAMRDPARRDWMAVLAKAPPDALAAAFAALGDPPAFTWLRPPEPGTVMVQGRAGATGGPFNLGEMTVTRCALRLEDGAVGHAYVPGHDRDKARIAALCDALLQGPRAAEVQAAVIRPLAARHRADRAAEAAKADGTRVEFFTIAGLKDRRKE